MSDGATIERFKELLMIGAIPQVHIDYLRTIDRPGVIYDIGSCVGHWAREAIRVWNSPIVYLFDAMEAVQPLYEHWKLPHHCGVLSDVDGKEIEFFENLYHPGGNSYYRENSVLAGAELFNSPPRKTITRSLDSICDEKGFYKPQLIKMDVQGAELDILKGAAKCLERAQHLILELQHTDYNIGAPKRDEVIEWLKERNWKLVSNFCRTIYDGDYHFIKIT